MRKSAAFPDTRLLIPEQEVFMIRFLQKTKSKRGFSLIEMIVVIGIIAILAAVILPSMNVRKSLISEAESNAKNFYVVTQNIFTKYSLYEAPLSVTMKLNPGDDFMQFFSSVGGNFPFNYDPANKTVPAVPKAANLYLEVKVDKGEMTAIVDNSWEKILKRAPEKADSEFTEVFKTELDETADMPDGFYYAKISYEPVNADASNYVPGTVKVAFAAYRENELPQLTGTYDNYKSTVLHFKDDNVISDDTVCGVCAAYNGTNTVGCEGTYLE